MTIDNTPRIGDDFSFADKVRRLQQSIKRTNPAKKTAGWLKHRDRRKKSLRIRRKKMRKDKKRVRRRKHNAKRRRRRMKKSTS